MNESNDKEAPPPGPSGHDRRFYIRYQISTGVRLDFADLSVEGRAVELSIYGIRLRTDKAVYPDARVQIYFQNLKNLLIQGHVIWTLGTTNELGLHFYEVGVFIEKITLGATVAAGLAARTELLPDILLAVKEID